MNESLLNELCEVADSFYRRGYAHGSTGNISVREGENVWITPTGNPLKGLTPDRMAHITVSGQNLGTAKPSKEYPFHLAVYEQRLETRAVVHLHTLYSVALSCLESTGDEPLIAPLTPYFFMRVAPLAVIPYFRPGSEELAEAVRAAAPHHRCMLLRNHGVICAGATLSEAVDRAEELEQTARLQFILRGESVRTLNGDQVEELYKR